MSNFHVWKIHSKLPQFLLIQKVYVGFVYVIYDHNFSVLTVNSSYSLNNENKENLNEVFEEIIKEYNLGKYQAQEIDFKAFMESVNGKNSI